MNTVLNVLFVLSLLFTVYVAGYLFGGIDANNSISTALDRAELCQLYGKQEYCGEAE